MIRTPRRFFALLIVCIMAMSAMATSSYAISRPTPGGSCSGDTCSGYNSGEYGSQFSNTGGSGDLAGYSLVRFDGYSPIPGLIECDPAGSDKALYADLGVPRNYNGISYKHRRTAILRSDNKTVVAGIENGPRWNTGEDINLNSGATRPSGDLDKSPSHSSPWIGPQWLGRERCLPLRGGVPVDDALKAAKPVLAFNNVTAASGVVPKAIVGQKKAKLNIEIHTDALPDPDIAIYFHFNDIVALGCDMDKNEKHKAETGEDSLYGCFLATEKKSPFYLKTNGVNFKDNGTTPVEVKFNKKGRYALWVLASFDGKVLINGQPVALDSTGVSSLSDPINFRVISAKSVSRVKK